MKRKGGYKGDGRDTLGDSVASLTKDNRFQFFKALVVDKSHF